MYRRSWKAILISWTFVIVVAEALALAFMNVFNKRKGDAIIQEGIQARLGAFYFTCIFWAVMALVSSSLFVQKSLIFFEERNSGLYSTASYFIAKVFPDIMIFRILPAVFFSLVVYWQIGQQPGAEKYFIYLAIIILVSVTTASFVFMISALSRSAQMASLISVVATMIFLLWGGALMNSEKTNIKIFYASPIYWGYMGLMKNEVYGLGSFNIETNGISIGSISVSDIVKEVNVPGTFVLTFLGLLPKDSDDSTTFALVTTGVLLGMTVFFLLVSYAVLSARRGSQR